jgi:hypothetical protein
MIVAIQQPEHIPWIGFFNKMAQCDLFILLDNVQFKKRYFENRNRILGRDGVGWLNVPVVSKGRYRQSISAVQIADEAAWRRKYMEQLRYAYGKHPHGGPMLELMKPVIMAKMPSLCELNIQAIVAIRDYLGIDTPIRLASELIQDDAVRGHELILALCRTSGGKLYISGPDGSNYLDAQAFARHNIDICYHHFEHPVYNQKPEGGEFVSHLSILDLIANHGPEAFKVVRAFKLDLTGVE